MITKHLLLSLMLVLQAGIIRAQNENEGLGKPPLNEGTFNKWVAVGEAAISPNGQFVCFIRYQRMGNHTLVIKSRDNQWEKEFENGTDPGFTRDSKFLVFQSKGDSVCVLNLIDKAVTCIQHATGYKFAANQTTDWLVCRTLQAGSGLMILDLFNKRTQTLPGVTDFEVAPDDANLLLRSDKPTNISLQMFNLTDGKLKTVWSAVSTDEKIEGSAFDVSGNQLTFLISNTSSRSMCYALWYYHAGMDTAQRLTGTHLAGLDTGFVLGNQAPSFSADGKRIFFKIDTSITHHPRADAVQVDIWNYKDPQLQSVQLSNIKYKSGYAAVIDVTSKKILRIEQKNEHIFFKGSDNYVLVQHAFGWGDLPESAWNKADRASFYLLSLKDGSRKLLKADIVNPDGDVGLSPKGKWVIYYDFKQNNFFSYEVVTGKTRNITKNCRTHWTLNDGRPRPSLNWAPWQSMWLSKDQAVLVYDNYDVWQIDPAGKKAPINLTNGYGKRNRIKFRLYEDPTTLANLILKDSAYLTLSAQYQKNKDCGFYRVRPNLQKDPECLSSGPYIYGDDDYDDFESVSRVKAQDAIAFVIKRQNALNAPNYYVTTDFRHFTQISDVQPQRPYNWLTTELIHWKTFDGSIADGILYKPENFDPAKKYPIIFNYYEIRSQELNQFIAPKASEGNLNIPWFVSHGYLVFVPDISHEVTREPGIAAFNSVVSAAKYMAKFSWVDAKKMGIQGHSFGGYETNYLVTHTNIFAAACSASGFCDLFSFYGSDLRDEYAMFWAENDQGRIGFTPWQRPDIYIRNSPIFKAARVTTPLLLMANKADDNVVSFQQGVEFFIGLRRMHKKVWMLQYDGYGHGLENAGLPALDYNRRMTQFFDHYLKDAPAPKWMAEGIPASKKGIDDGLALEPVEATSNYNY